ncbi:hypothetical protein [Actinokineospora xionganensis]|uniref:Uncharacterized protein n=1 Tax=Actinokineospora xionganensis TaxID=2684470 RepID=A0ABR7L177_9PSEU|nr:hypothetical protein [Actinokineospora xionganensis]MBC6446426.1 hypothetical protein [Actinokineospora xionganensis]
MTVRLAAVVLFLALRLSADGWLLVIYLFTVIGPVLTLAPLFFAIRTAKRGTLPSDLAAPFVAAAVSLVGAGLLVADYGDTPTARIPVLGSTRVGSDSALMALDAVGWLFVLGFIGSVVWIFVAVRMAGPPAPTRKGVVIGASVAVALVAVVVVPIVTKAPSNAGDGELAGRMVREAVQAEDATATWETCDNYQGAQYVVSMAVYWTLADIELQLGDRVQAARWDSTKDWESSHATTLGGHEVVARRATIGRATVGTTSQVEVKSTCVAVGEGRARELEIELPAKLGT